MCVCDVKLKESMSMSNRVYDRENDKYNRLPFRCAARSAGPDRRPRMDQKEIKKRDNDNEITSKSKLYKNDEER